MASTPRRQTTLRITALTASQLKRERPNDSQHKLVKLSDGSGKLPVATFWREKDAGRPAGPHQIEEGLYHYKTKVWTDAFQWAYWGVTPQAESPCTCHTGRFDIDGYARIFMPSMHLFSVMVLDTNGNRILRMGRYGNVDSQGPESLVPEPDIGFAWVRAVAASDTALYAMDYGNKRVLKAALSYEAEEEVPLP